MFHIHVKFELGNNLVITLLYNYYNYIPTLSFDTPTHWDTTQVRNLNEKVLISFLVFPLAYIAHSSKCTVYTNNPQRSFRYDSLCLLTRSKTGRTWMLYISASELYARYY